MLFEVSVVWAFTAASRTPVIFGIAIAAMTAMTAITTRSSIKLNAWLSLVLMLVFITRRRYGGERRRRNFRDLVFFDRVFLYALTGAYTEG